MTPSLRSRVVEAGVDAIINDRGIGDVIVGSDEWVMVWEDVVVALDAALDCLTENLTETVQIQDDGSLSYPMALEDLYAEQFLAVLRERQ